MVGKTIERELFGDVNPIDKTIRVGNIPFRVVGTLKSKGLQNSVFQIEVYQEGYLLINMILLLYLEKKDQNYEKIKSYFIC